MEQKQEKWLRYGKGILKAQLFIQEHLEEPLQLDEIARAACFSPYHFHRIFRAFTGETLNDFVRRLRMEKAAGQLKYTQKSITVIALESGYQTPSSFSRAFQQVMGVSPQRYREGVGVNRPIMKKKYSTKEKSMETPEIIHMNDLSVLFVRRVGSYQETPPQAWEELLRFAKENHPNLEQARRFSIGLDDPDITEPEKLRFDACLTAPKDVIEKGGIYRQTLKGGRYAVFLHKGPYEKLEQTFDAIFGEWYPENKDQVADHPCFCEHLNMQLMESRSDELITKIYVPLV